MKDSVKLSKQAGLKSVGGGGVPSHLFSVGHMAATEAVLCLENKEMMSTLINQKYY